jgi:predicted  nucleic acid-binding Zn-ribbon protein
VPDQGDDAAHGADMGEACPMSSLDKLLELQANDTAADQLRHRRANLPEQAELKRLAAVVADKRAALLEPHQRRSDLQREQRRLEDEIAMVTTKIASVDSQLYGSSMTSPKEAQALQADLESQNRRRSTLEDQVLELMEQIEPLDELLGAGEAAIAEVEAEAERVRTTLDEHAAELDAEAAEVAAARAPLAAGVDADLLAEYERLRPLHGGVAVARLSGPTCLGCHISLAAAEVDQLRRQPAGAIVHCPDCGCLLVR